MPGTSRYPLLEDWAEIYGVTIEWVHEWEKAETKRMTAFGYDQDGVAKHHTLIIPNRRSPAARSADPPLE